MIEKLIQKHIDALSIEDIDSFGRKNGIILKSQELEVIYRTVKEKWSVLLNGNTDQVFEDVRPFIQNDNYEKIKDLFYYFKEKYKNYL